MTTSIFPQTRITGLLGITKPIIQAGMVYVSGAKLAAAAANAGCLGVVGAGSMQPELLEQQLAKVKTLSPHPIAVNIPLLYSRVEEQIEVALRMGIRIFITSAGSPKKHTPHLKANGCVVLHVSSTPTLALKCQDEGVDAVVVEGFEAGGHNGRDELTTLILLQQCKGQLEIPLIAAGGIGSGAAILAALALGAEGVQIGTLFAASKESSAHPNFKDEIVKASFGATMLRMKKVVPVRLLENKFARHIESLEEQGASAEELKSALGKGRARRGMLEGDTDEGELEIGQIASQVHHVQTVAEILHKLEGEFQDSLNRIDSFKSRKKNS